MKVLLMEFRMNSQAVMFFKKKKLNAVLKNGRYFLPELHNICLNPVHPVKVDKNHSVDKNKFIGDLLTAWSIDWTKLDRDFIQTIIWCKDNKSSKKAALEKMIDSFLKTINKTDEAKERILKTFKLFTEKV